MEIDNVWLLVFLGVAGWLAVDFYRFSQKKTASEAAARVKKPLPPPPATAPSESEREAIISRAQPWLEQVLTQQLPAMWRTELKTRLATAKENADRHVQKLQELQDKLSTATDAKEGSNSHSEIQSDIDSGKKWQTHYERLCGEFQAQIEKDEQPVEEVRLLRSVREVKDIATTCRNVLRTLFQLRLRAKNLLDVQVIEHFNELNDLLRQGMALLPRLVPAVPKEGIVAGNVVQLLTQIGAWHMVPVALAAEEHVVPEWTNKTDFQNRLDEHILDAKSKVNNMSEVYPYLCRENFSLKKFPSIAAIEMEDHGPWPMLLPELNLSLAELIAFGLDPHLPKDSWSKDKKNEVLEKARLTTAKWRAAMATVDESASSAASALPLLFKTPHDVSREIRERYDADHSDDDSDDKTDKVCAAIARDVVSLRTEVSRLLNEVEPALSTAFANMTTVLAEAKTYEAKCAAVEKYREVEENLLHPAVICLNLEALKRMSGGKDLTPEVRVAREAKNIAFTIVLLEKYEAKHGKAAQSQSEVQNSSADWEAVKAMVAQSVVDFEKTHRPLPPLPATAPSDSEREAISSRAQPWLEQVLTVQLPAMWRTELRLRLVNHQKSIAEYEEEVRLRTNKLAATDANDSAARKKIQESIDSAREWQKRSSDDAEKVQQQIAKDVQPEEEVALLKSIRSEKDIATICRNVLRALIQLRLRAKNLLGLECTDHRKAASDLVRDGLALLPRLVSAVPKEGLVIGNVLQMLIQIGAWHLVPVCFAAEEHVKPEWSKSKHVAQLRNEQHVTDVIFKAMREARYENEPSELYPLLEHYNWTLNTVDIASAFKNEDWPYENALVELNQSLVELIPLGVDASRRANLFSRDDDKSPVEAARLLKQEWSSGVEASKLSDETAKAGLLWQTRFNLFVRDFQSDSSMGLKVAANIAEAAGIKPLAKLLDVGSSVAATASAATEGVTVGSIDASIRAEVVRLRTEVEPVLKVAFAEMTTSLAAAKTYQAKVTAVEKYRAVEEKLLKPEVFRLTQPTVEKWEDRSQRIAARSNELAHRIAFLLALLDKYEMQQQK